MNSSLTFSGKGISNSKSTSKGPLPFPFKKLIFPQYKNFLLARDEVLTKRWISLPVDLWFIIAWPASLSSLVPLVDCQCKSLCVLK